MEEIIDSRLLFLTLIVSVCFCAGCNKSEAIHVESAAFYAKRLKDKDFVWQGPVASGDRVPTVQAARALAFVGDESAGFLFSAIEDREVDIYSVYDALRELGIPVEQFHESIVENRDAEEIKQWWMQNKESSKDHRSKIRAVIGLPPIRENNDQETGTGPVNANN